MKTVQAVRRACLALALMAVPFRATPAFAAMDVVGNRYDNNRTATNPTETTLSPTTVSAATFGKLWTYTVSGAIFAQPLYVRGVAIAGQGTHNVLYVATMNDVVYAFDADAGGNPLWVHNYLSPGIAPGTPFDTTTASSAMGIIGTPAIDLPSNCMYFVAETIENGAYVQRLHAIDIRSGAELATAVIGGLANGVAFNPKQHSQRPGLALSAGQVWLAFGSTIPGDFNPWYGWVMTYDMTSLAQTGIFRTTAGSGGGGIWQSGAAPSVDANGNVYFLTGNGTGQAYDGFNNFQESLLKFSFNGRLTLADWYTTADWQTLDNYDLDITAGGSTIIPGTSLIAFGGKVGLERILNTANLGHFNAADSQVVQKLQVGPVPNYVGNDGDRILGLAYWDRRPNPSLVFAWPGNYALTSFAFNGTSFTQSAQNATNLFGEPSAALSLSANGTTPGSGILWVAHNAGAGRAIGQAAVLEAYNADNISSLLWTSNQNAARDALGSSGRFVIPVVNNGHVYMATSDGAVQVYGPISGATPPPPPANGWTQIGVNAQRVARASDGTTISVNSADGSLWRYNGAPRSWTNIPVPVPMTDVAIVNANSVYAIGNNKLVYRLANGAWTAVGHNVAAIGAAADGTVVAAAVGGSIWRKATDSNVDYWINVPGAAKRVAPMSASVYWSIGADSNVYRGGPSGGWAQAGVNVADIAASTDGRILVTNLQTNSLWLKVGDNTVPNWSNLPMTALGVSIASGGGITIVGTDHNVYSK